MLMNLNKIFTGFLLLFFMFSFVVAPVSVDAQSQGAQKALTGLDSSAEKSGFKKSSEKAPELATVIGNIIGRALQFIGVLFLLLMIYGGIIWMIARGNETEVQKAKDIIQAAIIGLVIVMAAYAVTAYIGSALSATPAA